MRRHTRFGTATNMWGGPLVRGRRPRRPWFVQCGADAERTGRALVRSAAPWPGF